MTPRAKGLALPGMDAGRVVARRPASPDGPGKDVLKAGRDGPWRLVVPDTAVRKPRLGEACEKAAVDRLYSVFKEKPCCADE